MNTPDQQPVTTGNPRIIPLETNEVWQCLGCYHTFIGVKYDPVCFHCIDPLGTDISKQYNTYEDDSQGWGWIQWKGTQACMDVHCKCGAHMHIDAGFAYYIECPYCNTVYSCDPNIHFVELTETQAVEARKLTGAIVTPDKEDDDYDDFS